MEIDCRGLRKRYGRTTAVDGLTCTVVPGRVTGLAGPNGAGKSTTLRMILGLSRPDAGTVHIGGTPYARLERPLHTVGALLDAGAAHPGRRARDHLRWLAHAGRIPTRRVDDVLERVGLSAVAGRRVGGFSLGMRQRLGIAAALLGDAPVLLLDEPVNGLDPEGVRWIRVLLRGLAAEGRTVLVSSHLMSELADTADHLLVLGRGRLVADTGVRDLIAAATGERALVRTSRPAETASALRAAGATLDVTADALIVDGVPRERIAALLTAHALPFSELAAYPVSLEEAYLRLTREAVEFR